MRTDFAGGRLRLPVRTSRTRAAVVAAAGVCVLLTAGCGAAQSSAAPQPGSTQAVAATSPAQGQATPSASTTTGTPAPPLPQSVTTPVPKVTRDGVRPSPTATATTAPFSAPVVYPDGVKLTITKVTKGVDTGTGPGMYPGRQFVLFSVTLTNSSSASINLDQVVVTAYYGSTNQLAQRDYTEGTGAQDFAGVVQAGRSASAAYAFALPSAGFTDLTLVVDFDGHHSSAVYHGSISPQ